MNSNHHQALAALLLVAFSHHAQAQTDADWPTYNHDVLGWRFNSAEKTLGVENVGRLVEKWRFPATGSKETIGAVHATPAVVDGEVYFGTGTFPAFYKLGADGSLKWVYRNPARKAVLPPAPDGVLGDKLGSMIKAGGIMSSALVAEGAVYFADTGGWVYCLDAATGVERWKADMRASSFPGAHPGYLTLCSPILADGKIIIGGGTMEQMYAGTAAYTPENVAYPHWAFFTTFAAFLAASASPVVLSSLAKAPELPSLPRGRPFGY